MRGSVVSPTWKSLLIALVAVLFLAGPGRAQQAPATSAEHESKAGPVVRTFGAEGGYRTEVRSETKGTLGQDDRRQVSLLAAQVFQHVDEARRALDADDAKQARKEVDKGREAIKAVRALLPTTTVHTRTTAPDGKVIYEDEREVQEDRVPLFEGMLHARTLAPIQEAQRDASRVAGVRVVESETISTEVTADLDYRRGPARPGGQGPGRQEDGGRHPGACSWRRSGASTSATARRTRRWPRPATRSGWPSAPWRRTTPPRPRPTWPSPASDWRSTARSCPRTSART